MSAADTRARNAETLRLLRLAKRQILNASANLSAAAYKLNPCERSRVYLLLSDFSLSMANRVARAESGDLDGAVEPAVIKAEPPS